MTGGTGGTSMECGASPSTSRFARAWMPAVRLRRTTPCVGIEGLRGEGAERRGAPRSVDIAVCLGLARMPGGDDDLSSGTFVMEEGSCSSRADDATTFG